MPPVRKASTIAHNDAQPVLRRVSDQPERFDVPSRALAFDDDRRHRGFNGSWFGNLFGSNLY